MSATDVIAYVGCGLSVLNSGWLVYKARRIAQNYAEKQWLLSM